MAKLGPNRLNFVSVIIIRKWDKAFRKLYQRDQKPKWLRTTALSHASNILKPYWDYFALYGHHGCVTSNNRHDFGKIRLDKFCTLV